jgi:type I restriction enzyme S subunit
MTRAPLRVPSEKNVQIAIAKILGALDDKIELNRRLSETLEAIAQALFQSRFVDFDPVRAKASGEAPESICQRLGLTPDLLALFPNEFEDAAGVETPAGWSFASAAEVSEVGIGKTPPRKESEWFSDNPEHVRWLSIRDMGLSDAFARRSSEALTPEAIGRFNIRRVPDYTVLLSFKLTIGRLAITDGEMATNEAIAHFKLNRETRVTTEYLYFYLKNFDFDSLGSTSSIAEAVNSRMIRDLPILVPPADLIDAFSKQARGLLMLIKEIGRQTDCLIQTRHTLLPRLLSGEISVLPSEAP